MTRTGNNIGDLRVAVTLGGEPTRVRSAYNLKFAKYQITGAIIWHQRRFRFVRQRRGVDLITPQSIEFNSIEPGSKVAAESTLSRVCHLMEASDIRYAQQLIDTIHRAATNTHPIADIDREESRFWLSIRLEGDAASLMKVVEGYLRKEVIEGIKVGLFLRDGRPPKPTLRWLLAGIASGNGDQAAGELDTLRGRLRPEHYEAAKQLIGRAKDVTAQSERSRLSTIQERARTVLGEHAANWFASAQSWHRSFWGSVVELDFIQANRDESVAWLQDKTERGDEPGASAQELLDKLLSPAEVHDAQADRADGEKAK